jgi:rod shape-determining protein MreD
MNREQTIAMFTATYLAVYVSIAFDLPRDWLGTPVSLLPALAVYAAIQHSVWGITAVAVFGGLLQDSFSGDPLGISVAALFSLGYALNRKRDFVMHQLPFARMLLGFLMGGAVTVISFTLASMTTNPAVTGAMVMKTVFVSSVASAILTPLTFRIFNRLHRTFTFRTVRESSVSNKISMS